MEKKTGSDSRRVCRRCLLRMEMGEEAAGQIDKYLAVLKPEDLAPEDQAQARLAVCRECPELLEGTCQACGCYVEFRANSRRGTCPRKKWL